MKVHNTNTLVKLVSMCLLLGLGATLIVGSLIGCGKLSDDTDRPSSPVGTTGGLPVPIEPRSSVGTYTLSLSATPNAIPADGINFTTLDAYLTDSSGRSVANFAVVFESDDLGRFSVPGTGVTTTTTGFTDASGHVSVRFLGVQSGSAVVQASIDLDQDGNRDIFAETTVFLEPGGPPSSAGSYRLTLRAFPDTIPADMATYSIISATLTDSTGGSVENHVITFTADLGYLENDPEGPSSLSTTATGITNKDGSSSVYLYGSRAGSAIIQARVFVNDLVGTLQATTVVDITEGVGVPGTGVPGVRLTVDKTSETIDAGTCGETDPVTTDFTLTARVWDETGDLVGAGTRVELTGSGVDENLERDGLTDSTGTVTFVYTYTRTTPGVYPFEVTAHTIINGVEYTDTTNYTLVVTCTPEEEAGIELAQIIVEPQEIQTLETSTITVQVTSEGQPLSGATVSFTTNLTGASISPSSTTTDAAGLATATFTAGATPGTATILISASAPEGGVTGSAEITVIDAPATITARAPDLALTLGGLGSTNGPLNLSATITNAGGDFIEGAAVGFSIIDPGCSGITISPLSGSGTTDISGLAQFSTTVTATSTLGSPCSYTLTATTGTISDSDTGTITVNP
ncbi:hypothetical protein GF339_19590 [candidate division KSB3 bacterium]|uniref:Big-1 domain-containing protein n=1 Tax=candidate division KSB3 bacterium TaxID=2044937 RepID=A0A9D5JZS3_9BACT|nr:hypothetical protein [candidate division KSB3 bacterium]